MGSLFGRTRARFGQIVAGFSRLASYKTTGESSWQELARQSMSRCHINLVTASGAESCRRDQAENFMMQVMVDDLDAWWARIESLDLKN